MKQLNNIESAVLLMGALLMVIGSGAAVMMQQWAPYVFAAGAMAFVLMQLKQRYEGHSTTIRRLRCIMVVSDVMFVVAAMLMFANKGNFLGLKAWHYAYYIHNNWVVALLIAAVLQMYSTHRISHELKKEQDQQA